MEATPQHNNNSGAGRERGSSHLTPRGCLEGRRGEEHWPQNLFAQAPETGIVFSDFTQLPDETLALSKCFCGMEVWNFIK